MLSIYLFGHLRLFYHQEPFEFKALPKTFSLFAYLLLHRHTPVSRDGIAYLLWDDVPESEARANLRRHLHDLQRALPPALPDKPWVLRVNRTLQWNEMAPCWLDIAAFTEIRQQADRLAEAAALYTGDILTDSYEEWLIPFRERLHEQYLQMLTQLLYREQERQDYRQAMMYARQLLQQDPAREDVVRTLIRLHVDAGDRAGALRTYLRFKERLHEELGVTPLPETAVFYEALIHNQPLPAEETAVSSPPPAQMPPAQPILSSGLPSPLTRFIGRETELAALLRLLNTAESAVRLLTMTGPGGSGKTRLALEAAHYLQQQTDSLFPHGVFFVPLADLSQPEQVVTAVAETIGMSLDGNHSIATALLSYLQERQLLLILDNFEYLLDAASFISDWLTAAPGVRILVTSQVLLHLYGEHEFPLAPLPLPDLAHLPDTKELLMYAAIALFVDRASAVRPNFALTNENAAAVAAVCACLDGMPLAIELAAARSKFFTPAAMLTQLTQRLKFLTGQARNLPTRQQTLRATLDWSYALLAQDEQAVFRCLSIFAGPFTLTAAMAVVDTAVSVDHLLFDVIAALVDKNMVRALVSPDDIEPHFRLLQTLREYGLEKLGQIGLEADMRQRHAIYYLKAAESAFRDLALTQQGSYLQSLTIAHDNLRAALTWAAAHNDASMGLRLSVAMASFWEARGHIHEGWHWLTQFLQMPTASLPADRAAALHAAGTLAFRQAEFTHARTYYEQSLALWQTLPDQQRQVARVMLRLGILLKDTAENELAQAYYDQSLAIFRELQDPSGIATVLKSLGNIAYMEGDFMKAQALYEECLAAERRLHAPGKIAGTLNNLALAAYAMGDMITSQALHREALALRRQLDIKPGVAQSLYNLGMVLLAQGTFAESWQMQQESLELYTHMGYRIGMVEAWECLGMLAARQEQPERAARLLAAATHWRVVLQASRDQSCEAAYTAALSIAQAECDKMAWQVAWREGEMMSLETAVAYARQESYDDRLLHQGSS